MKKRLKLLRLRRGAVMEGLGQLVEVLEFLEDQIMWAGLIVDDVKQNLANVFQQRPELYALLTSDKTSRRSEVCPVSPVIQYATSVKIEWNLNMAEVSIDGRLVDLPRKLGMLLEVILVEADPASPEGWKSRALIRHQLEIKTGSKITKHCLENLLSRLRAKFRRQAGLEHLLQSDPDHGIRFSLQKYSTQTRNDVS